MFIRKSTVGYLALRNFHLKQTKYWWPRILDSISFFYILGISYLLSRLVIILAFMNVTDKGPSLYYVRVFWGFLNHPPTYVRTFSLHKVRENCHFLDHPPTPKSLRNIKIAPYHCETSCKMRGNLICLYGLLRPR